LHLIELLSGQLKQVNLTAKLSDCDITGLTADSRAVEPGFLFAALPGKNVDGRSYIKAAIAKGAVAVLAPEGTEIADDNVALLTSTNTRAALAHISAAFYREQPKTISAVTGTNGKTSVAHFTRQIWSMLGHQAVSLGTLGLHMPDNTFKPTLTTPDPITLHRHLSALARDGASHAVLEASSHGLEQSRMDGIHIRAAAFTNLSRDHLDYHGSVQNYLASKLRLFTSLLPPEGIAVLNADIPEFAELAAAVNGSIFSYGHQGKDIILSNATPAHNGTHVSMQVLGRPYDIDLPLVGTFQVYNVMCAAGLAISCGENRADVVNCLQRLQGAPGRLERAGVVNGAGVYIDYAHTPDALENVLTALRPYTTRQLAVVFGCGGDRDRGKRPMMGRVAGNHADRVFVTDDNPRSESASTIRREIMQSAPNAIEISNRADAIGTAVKQLEAGDVLVIAGKGHEIGQIVAGEVRPFEDLIVARNTIEMAGGTL
jgi:UDP-N-acetylmuramoyl-L-alanyl-D-glutamate--2,6-diaminopimelate ligase